MVLSDIFLCWLVSGGVQRSCKEKKIRSMAASIFGLEAALILRIGTNVFASLYSLLFNTVFQKVAAWFVKFSDDRDVLKGTV